MAPRQHSQTRARAHAVLLLLLVLLAAPSGWAADSFRPRWRVSTDPTLRARHAQSFASSGSIDSAPLNDLLADSSGTRPPRLHHSLYDLPASGVSIREAQSYFFVAINGASYRSWQRFDPNNTSTILGPPYSFFEWRSVAVELLRLYEELKFDVGGACAPQLARAISTLQSPVEWPEATDSWWWAQYFPDLVDALSCGAEQDPALSLDPTVVPWPISPDVQAKWASSALVRRVWRLVGEPYMFYEAKQRSRAHRRADRDLAMYVPFLDFHVDRTYMTMRRGSTEGTDFYPTHPFFFGPFLWGMWHTLGQRIADLGEMAGPARITEEQVRSFTERALVAFTNPNNPWQVCPHCREHFLLHVSLNDQDAKSFEESEAKLYTPEYAFLGVARGIDDSALQAPTLGRLAFKKDSINVSDPWAFQTLLFKLHSSVTSSIESSMSLTYWEELDDTAFATVRWPFSARYRYSIGQTRDWELLWRQTRDDLQDELLALAPFRGNNSLTHRFWHAQPAARATFRTELGALWDALEAYDAKIQTHGRDALRYWFTFTGEYDFAPGQPTPSGPGGDCCRCGDGPGGPTGGPTQAGAAPRTLLAAFDSLWGSIITAVPFLIGL